MRKAFRLAMFVGGGVAGLVLVSWGVAAQVSKPGQPGSGGVFTLSEQLSALKIPKTQPFARQLLSDGAHSSVFAFKGKDGIKPHYHRDHDEVVYMVSGKGTFTLAGESHPIQAGMVMVIPAGVVHSATFEGEVEALIVNGPVLDPARPDRVWVEQSESKDSN